MSRIIEDEIYHMTEGFIKSFESLKNDHPDIYRHFEHFGYDDCDSEGNPYFFYQRWEFFDKFIKNNHMKHIANGLGLFGVEDNIWDYFSKFGITAYSDVSEIEEILTENQDHIFDGLSPEEAVLLQDNAAYCLSDTLIVVSDSLIMIN